MIAALFVRRVNHYAALGVDCYDEKRDALTWRGGSPAIYHPPCRGWGKFKGMCKPAVGELALGLWSMAMVRAFGGVVEHPASSSLWAATGCASWGVRDQFGGVLVPVLQSWWGHRAPKETCLYIVGAPVPALPFDLVDPGGRVERMGRPERERTTPAFAAFLVDLARSCHAPS